MATHLYANTHMNRSCFACCCCRYFSRYMLLLLLQPDRRTQVKSVSRGRTSHCADATHQYPPDLFFPGRLQPAKFMWNAATNKRAPVDSTHLFSPGSSSANYSTRNWPLLLCKTKWPNLSKTVFLSLSGLAGSPTSFVIVVYYSN